jgi:hypothetical protein
MRHLAAVAVSALLLGCAPAVTVRAPVLDLPPVPPKLLEPCEEPTPLKGGTQADLYLKMLEDVGPWGRCIRKDDALIEVIKYRESVVEKYRADAAKPQPKFRWFWQ